MNLLLRSRLDPIREGLDSSISSFAGEFRALSLSEAQGDHVPQEMGKTNGKIGT